MSKYINIENKKFLVTGASSGIGQATAIELARLGAQLVITGRDHTRLEITLQQLNPNLAHSAFEADLNEQSSINALVDRCGKVDGLVHCAGIQRLIPFKLMNQNFLNDIMDTNFKSAIMLTQRLNAKSSINNGGSIIFLSSIAAHTGTSGVLPYSAAKSALEGAMRCLAVELATKKIRVNSVAPSIVRTPMFPEDMEEWLNEQERKYPLGLGTTRDVANAVIFLLSNSALYMTGTTLIMDGGCNHI